MRYIKKSTKFQPRENRALTTKNRPSVSGTTYQGLQRCRPFLCLNNCEDFSRLLKQIAENLWFDLSGQIFDNSRRGLQTRIFGHGLPVIGPPDLAAVKLALTDVGTVDRPHHTADDSTGF